MGLSYCHCPQKNKTLKHLKLLECCLQLLGNTVVHRLVDQDIERLTFQATLTIAMWKVID